MPGNAKRAREEWLQADQLARLKEEELKAAWGAYAERRGLPPSDELMREAARLRALANASLSAALAAFDPYLSPRKED